MIKSFNSCPKFISESLHVGFELHQDVSNRMMDCSADV